MIRIADLPGPAPRWLLGPLFAGLLFAGSSTSAVADAFPIEAVSIDLDDNSREGAAGLMGPDRARFEAGFELRSRDPDFGGLSGLWLAPDGTRLLMTSDRGHFFEAVLDRDFSGRLTGVVAVRKVGMPPEGLGLDSEALATVGASPGSPSGPTVAVSFEQNHRLRLFDAATLERADNGLDLDLDGLGLPRNRGLEAVADLEDGDLLALAEGLSAGPGRSRGWILGAGPPVPLAYRTTGAFVPTGADREGPDLYVLERRFSFLGGFGTRVVRIDAGSVGPGAILAGEEVLRIAPPLPSENYEGIAISTEPDGRTLLYLVSDDNFNALQRTLLLQFSLRLPER